MNKACAELLHVSLSNAFQNWKLSSDDMSKTILLFKFVDGIESTALCGAVDTPKGWDAIQRDLGRMNSGPRRTS